jgi:MFS transporter, UMF1 family
MLFLVITPNVYLLGSLLAIVSNTCFGASFVLLNSFLPLLVRNHPSIKLENSKSSDDHSYSSSYPSSPPTSGTLVDELDGEEDEDEGHALSNSQLPEGSIDSETGLLTGSTIQSTGQKSAAASPALLLSTRISTKGIAVGYIGAVFVQIGCIALIKATGSTTFSLRLTLFVVGVWWLLFTIPAAIWLRPRPGPPLAGSDPLHPEKERSWLGYFTYAWKGLGKTITRARRLRDILFFLAAWFLVSDAIATVSGTAVLFAKTDLQMGPAALALISVVGTASGILGAFTWSKISTLFGWRPSQTILACICLFEVIPIYGLLGYLPFIQEWGVLGLQQPWEMYPLGAIYGFVLGGLSSYCRSLYGELIPPGSEAAFYALYAITDKGSSIFGPAIVGAITDATGDIRPAFWFLAVLVGLPAPLMWMVDVDRGKREGRVMAREYAKIDEATERRGRSQSASSEEGQGLLERREGSVPAGEELRES